MRRLMRAGIEYSERSGSLTLCLARCRRSAPAAPPNTEETMNRTIHEVSQGSPEWLSLRANYFTASEAPAMMGASKYQSRTDLLRQKKTGYTQEVNAAKQRLFDAGHAAEAAARPFAEDVLAQELYPVTCSAEIDGLPLLASLDGLTMDEGTIWEHKLWSESLVDQINLNNLDPHYYWQLEHQLLVVGAGRVLFMATSENQEAAEYCWYKSQPERRAQLIAGWKQFAADLAEYVQQEAAPEVIAAPVAGLGALVMQVEGRVVACNLDAFQAGAQAFLDRLPKAAELQSDQDFANAESAVKACAEAEDRIKSALDAAMAQAASIDELFRAARHISELIRSARLALDKSVKSRKESIRMEIMQDAQAKLSEHVNALNERIGWYNGCPIISPAAADFASAIKGKRTITSLRDACDTELARAKIATREIADRIEANRKAMGDHAALFPDFQHVCTKTPEDFANLVAVRVENERVRLESIKAAEINTRNVINPPAPLPESGAPVAVIQPSPQPVADDGNLISVSEISKRLGITVSSGFLASIGFAARRVNTLMLYPEYQWPAICTAIADHILSKSGEWRKRTA